MSDTDDSNRASRRDYLRATGALAAAGTVGLAGCTGGSPSGDGATGTLATQVTDQPGDIGDFDSCVVTIAGIWVKSGTEEETATADDGDDPIATGTAEESDDREYHEFDEPREADLVELQDGETSLVGEHEMATGEYAYLQLDVTGVAATLADGGDATVDTPGNAPLQFKQSFEIRADTRTVFTADFTPVRRGRSGSYLLRPVATGTSVAYEPTADAETTGTGTA
jgi:hypothetical protein